MISAKDLKCVVEIFSSGVGVNDIVKFDLGLPSELVPVGNNIFAFTLSPVSFLVTKNLSNGTNFLLSFTFFTVVSNLSGISNSSAGNLTGSTVGLFIVILAPTISLDTLPASVSPPFGIVDSISLNVISNSSNSGENLLTNLPRLLNPVLRKGFLLAFLFFLNIPNFCPTLLPSSPSKSFGNPAGGSGGGGLGGGKSGAGSTATEPVITIEPVTTVVST